MLYNKLYVFKEMNWRTNVDKLKVYLAEFLGTLLLVAMGTGAVVFAGGQGGILPVALAFGFAIVAAAYALGGISGAHLNPAVSLAMAINKRMGWSDFVGYVGAQLLGALAGSAMILGIWFSMGVKGEMWAQVQLGSTTYPNDGVVQLSAMSAGIIEAILTFFLVLIILMVTSKKFGAGVATGLVIALTLAGLIIVGGALTGASLNPARSFAPALFEAFLGNAKAMGQMGVYLVGPMVGGALAAVTAKYLGSEEA